MRSTPASRFPPGITHQTVVNCAAVNTTSTVFVVASSATGTIGTPGQKLYTSHVALTFFEVTKEKSSTGSSGTQAVLKQCYSMEIDRLRNKEKPQITQILFQEANCNGGKCSGNSDTQTEHMILCTHYGLMIQECSIFQQ